ncbi:MAG: type II toxin-antitoxin system prevent-host-death family antitoxin, partial [Synechococcaceae cyanobacterium]|nr:type II toxin-antitoxin system prevent-host-death family antitoxin [Synechococcaceae cyanobacterium]
RWGEAGGTPPRLPIKWSSDHLAAFMRRFSVAEAKAQLSALLQAVEAGEEVEITRRGTPVARLIRATNPPAPAAFDLDAFFAITESQPMHSGPNAAGFCRSMRDDARY